MDKYETILKEINSSGDDEIHLVAATPLSLHFEKRSSDAYRYGITEVAFDFIEPVYVQVPMIMTFAYLRICNGMPAHLSQFDGDGTAFEFYSTDYRSTGGPVHVRLFADGSTAIDNGVEVLRPEGYVVAADLVIRESQLISGNQLPSEKNGAS